MQPVSVVGAALPRAVRTPSEGWAALVAVGAALAFQDVLLGGVIALAMVINILVAAVSGSLLPSLLSLLGVDPAIAGGVVLTTITDVAGFFSFLGLATLVYA